MKRMGITGLLLAALVGLTGCENDAVSFQTSADAGGAGLTLIREQRWFWDKTAAVYVVVARMPDCQRRHALRPTAASDALVEVSQAGRGLFLLRQGDDWHAANVGDCSLQPVQGPAQGVQIVALGSFDRQGGKLVFSPSAQP
jgi:hypothetical protein